MNEKFEVRKTKGSYEDPFNASWLARHFGFDVAIIEQVSYNEALMNYEVIFKKGYGHKAKEFEQNLSQKKIGCWYFDSNPNKVQLNPYTKERLLELNGSNACVVEPKHVSASSLFSSKAVMFPLFKEPEQGPSLKELTIHSEQALVKYCELAQTAKCSIEQVKNLIYAFIVIKQKAFMCADSEYGDAAEESRVSYINGLRYNDLSSMQTVDRFLHVISSVQKLLKQLFSTMKSWPSFYESLLKEGVEREYIDGFIYFIHNVKADMNGMYRGSVAVAYGKKNPYLAEAAVAELHYGSAAELRGLG